MHLITLVADEAALIYILPTRALSIDRWSSFPLIRVLVAICIPGAPQRVWELRLLLQRKPEASQLRLGELLLDFFLEVNEFRLNFWVDVSGFCKWPACEGNDVALRSFVLDRCRT